MPLNNNQIEDKAKVLTEDPSPDAPSVNQGLYFVKDVSGVAEAFYKDDQSREIQLTNNGSSSGGGGGSSTLEGLSDTNLPSPTNGQFLKFDGSVWIAEALAGGGDLLSTNNLSDIANANVALTNIGGLAATDIIIQAEAEAGTSGDAHFWSSERVKQAIDANSNVSANTSKVSADGSVATHSDVDLTGVALNDHLKWDGAKFIPVALVGGGDLVAANNLSDVANAASSLSNLGGEPTITAGTTAQYFRGDKSLGTFDSAVGSATAVSTNTSKVSADGSVASHSDVDLTSISLNDFLQWDGSKFVAVALAGGGDMLTTNNLSDVANASTSLANLSGLDKTDIVSQVEAEAGTATTARTWTAERVKQAIDALGGAGGSGVGDDYRIQLGAGASIADKIAAAPTGGIPAGWTVKDGDDAGVDAQLSGNANDLILIHTSGKVGLLTSAVSVGGFGGWNSLDFSAAGSLKTEDNTLAQTRVLGFNTAAGATASILFVKLIDILP